MPTLDIDREDMILAFTSDLAASGGGWYLDRETGRILLASDDIPELPADLEDNPRYLAIDPLSSRDSYRIMEVFVAGLSDDAAAERLSRALRGPKPFRRFKDALDELPGLLERWHAFRDRALTRHAEDWCEAEGIEARWR